MSLSAVALDELLRGVVSSRPLRAACAFIAAQSGLAYAFYLEASIKEVTVGLLITLTVVLVVQTLRRPLAAAGGSAARDRRGRRSGRLRSRRSRPGSGIPVAVFVVTSAGGCAT